MSNLCLSQPLKSLKAVHISLTLKANKTVLKTIQLFVGKQDQNDHDKQMELKFLTPQKPNIVL